jgi:hypothetical protein
VASAPPPAAAPADERPAVELVLREYARAVSAGDLPGMQAVFPGMSPQARDGFKSMLKEKYTMDTSRWKYLEITVRGTSADAQLGGITTLRDNRGRTKTESAFPRHATLEKIGGGWRLTSIE